MRPERAKRLGEDHSEDEYQTVQESKQQRIGLIESVVEAMEDETVKIATLEGKLQMRICEEAVDLSYIGSADADLLEEVIEQTDVGGVRSQLDDRVVSFMMRSLCQAELPVGSGVQSAGPGEEGESIFDPGSKMGLQLSEAKDHWDYKPHTASWTRLLWCSARISSIQVKELQRRSNTKARSYRICGIADGLFPMEYDQSKTTGNEILESWRSVETW